MKTIIIWDEGNCELKFFLLDGDHSKFNEIYINAAGVDIELESELTALIFTEEGSLLIEPLPSFPDLKLLDPFTTKVIVAGFIP